ANADGRSWVRRAGPDMHGTGHASPDRPDRTGPLPPPGRPGPRHEESRRPPDGSRRPVRRPRPAGIGPPRLAPGRPPRAAPWPPGRARRPHRIRAVERATFPGELPPLHPVPNPGLTRAGKFSPFPARPTHPRIQSSAVRLDVAITYRHTPERHARCLPTAATVESIRALN